MHGVNHLLLIIDSLKILEVVENSVKKTRLLPSHFVLLVVQLGVKPTLLGLDV